MASHPSLLIRPGPSDHRVIEDLVAPGGSGIFRGPRPVIDELVLDATTVVRRPSLVVAAAHAGIPALVDPMTPLLQGEVDPRDGWVALPYGEAVALTPADLDTERARDDLVARVVGFEVERGATAVIPPYLHPASPDDPWFALTLDLLRRTARHMARSGVRLPLLPLLSAQLHTFGVGTAWSVGVDRFAELAGELGAPRVGLCLSPSGAATDTYGKVQRYFATALRLRAAGMAVVAWDQGVYGPALVAAGIDGYVSGIGVRERSDVASLQYRRRPASGVPGERRSPQMVLLQPLGRSLGVDVARVLLADRGMRAKLVCDDETCCSDGVESMLTDRRKHTVRARARYLAELAEMPHPDWRLYRVARDAHEAVTLTLQANQLLARLPQPRSLSFRAAEALAQTADRLLEDRLQRGA